MTIDYRTDPVEATAADLAGFFFGWPRPPAPDRRVALLRGASHGVLAWAGDRLVGFVTALSDGVLMAYVPLLEVLPEYQGRGIGTALVERVLAEIGDLYGVDVCCDEDLVPYYERFGFQRVAGMVLRR